MAYLEYWVEWTKGKSGGFDDDYEEQQVRTLAEARAKARRLSAKHGTCNVVVYENTGPADSCMPTCVGCVAYHDGRQDYTDGRIA